MNVDLDAIAQRGRCEVSSLRLALPLIEQGYTPPFLARYRRDELGGLDETSLWALSQAVRSQQRLESYREELHAAWQATRLQDPAIGRAVSNAKSRRLLDRLGRRIKSESGESSGLLNRLAVRVLNPHKGDGDDLEALAASLSQAAAEPKDPGTTEVQPDPTSETQGEAGSANVSVDLIKFDDTLAKRLSGDPRVVGAAVRWLSKHAKIHIIEVADPHGNSGADDDNDSEAKKVSESKSKEPRPAENKAAETEKTETVVAEKTKAPAKTEASEAQLETAAETPVAADTPVAAEAQPAPQATDGATESAEAIPVVEAFQAEAPASTEAASPELSSAQPEAAASQEPPAKPAKAAKKEKQAAKAAKKPKKISPRQRRRRWLVSTLKPLAGKRMPAAKLSAFQIVMLGRALRSQVAQCAFDYDATKLVAELQKTVTGFNRSLGDHLAKVLVANEASIRDAAEGAWWDEIQEQASSRLVTIAAENLHRQINRGGVEAKVVMSIDAIGPRTAATAIISADGRLLHSEDIPCQLSAAMRTLAVTKMGELIHKHHVDLIVISNGPARRACMVAVGELIKQSGEQSVRWTLADRSGADAYASSPAGDQEMKQTPRRFRSAAWIAFSTLQPSQAMVKVDPLKLRLGSFQRELSDQAVLSALEDVLISGAARGGVDVNSTTSAWLERLPGMNHAIASALDEARREKLITTRDDLLARGPWPSEVHSRQALPFLRVFESEETLDGTLIHPEDYALAKRLAKALEVELPPASPPGYTLPDYHAKPETAEAAVPQSAAPAADSDSGTQAEVIGDSAVSDSSESASEPVADQTASLETASLETASPEEATSENVESGEPAPEEAVAEVAGVEEPASEESDTTSAETTAEASETAEPATSELATTENAAEAVRRPKPEKAKVDKLIKEWQVGVRRSYQIVNWLCDPFGEGMVGGDSPAVMTSMPAMSELKQGDQVIGVVVGVMPFGVFVELSPECSGLIHVSRISDGYVEDLHEAVQVGDVVTAWVTGIDGKRRRVGLSAISPQREAELETLRRESRGPGRGQGGRGSDRRGRGAPADANAPAPARSGGQGGRGQGERGQGERGQGQTGQGQGGRGRQGAGAASRGNSGGNRGGGNRGGGRDGGRRDNRGGSRGPRRPEVYEVVGKEPDSPTLTDAMEQGKEPLRSFGDLMQLFTKEKGQPEKGQPEKQKPTNEVQPEQPSEQSRSAEQSQAIEPTQPIESTPPTTDQVESAEKVESPSGELS